MQRLLFISVFSVLLTGATTTLRSQINTLDFIYGGLEDTEKILAEYIKPYANAIGSDLNAGWYNTARPHQLGGLDVVATVSWAKVPASALSYDLSGLDLNGSLEPTKPSIAPTVAGEQEERPEVFYTHTIGPEEIEYARFTHPDGTGYDYFPLPMAQITIGLPFGTDVSGRFIPMIGTKDFGEIGLWGVGGKHSISQWIPGLKKLDLLDISVQGGYTKVTASAHLKIEPMQVDIDPDPDNKWEDQFLVQEVQGWTVNIIASQTLLLFTFYQGLGYSSSMVDVLMEGHYPIGSIITEGDDIGKTTYETIKDPITLSFENYSKLRINMGVRIKLGVFTIHYDFTHALYFTHTVGIGVSFR